ncbi:MAG TPA: hypothetical protein VG222_14010 [Vicinamibacterales bacterium]|nr:hypothetical protein [Vicinamibacterales bacterium]
MSGIEKLTEAEQLDLAERVHEAVLKFKLLRASSFWNVQTFYVSDLAGDLSRKQAVWLAGWIAFQMSIPTEVEVLRMPVELPEDLHAGKGEIYALSVDHEWLRQWKRKEDAVRIDEPAKISPNVVKLKFVVVERPQVAA